MNPSRMSAAEKRRWKKCHEEISAFADTYWVSFFDLTRDEGLEDLITEPRLKARSYAHAASIVARIGGLK